MIDTPETIRQQMDETRSQLSENLASLEHQVSKTVQSTGNAVNATVESVRETVETVTGAVQGAVQSVSNAFDIRRQVEKHPWLFLGGAVVAGYLAAELLSGPAKKAKQSPTMVSPPHPPVSTAPIVPASEPHKENSFWHHFSKAAVGPLMGIVQELATHATPLLVAYLAGNGVGDQKNRQEAPLNTEAPQGANGLRKQLNPSDWD